MKDQETKILKEHIAMAIAKNVSHWEGYSFKIKRVRPGAVALTMPKGQWSFVCLSERDYA